MDEIVAIIIRLIWLGVFCSAVAACFNWKHTKIFVCVTSVLMWVCITFGAGGWWTLRVSSSYNGLGDNWQLRKISLCDMGLLVGGNIMFLILYEKLESRRQEELKNHELSQQIKAGKEQADILIKSYQEQRRLTHDFRNHLYTMDSLMKNHDFEETEKYLSELIESSDQIKQIVHTGHPVIDAILNREYSVAREKNILMEFELNNLENVTLPNEEIVVILSNLLDNAVEACSEIAEHRRIVVKMKQSETELLLSVCNTTNHADFVWTGERMTTKKRKLQHGYGLQNVSRILERNHGEYAMKCKDGWFQFTAVISPK